MELLKQFFQHLHNLDDLIAWGGLVVLFFIIYAETGLFVGFFLPGDSLLVTAGVYAAAHADKLNIVTMIMALCVAAILGDNTGYWFGRKTGQSLFAREDSRIFKRKHLLSAQEFYDKNGPKTVVIARFAPIIRTFAPIVAGVAQMPYNRFLPFSIAGGIAWITSMSLLGYFVGKIPGVKQHIDKVIIVVVLVSLMPMVLHWWQERQRQAAGGGEPNV